MIFFNGCDGFARALHHDRIGSRVDGNPGAAIGRAGHGVIVALAACLAFPRFQRRAQRVGDAGHGDGPALELAGRRADIGEPQGDDFYLVGRETARATRLILAPGFEVRNQGLDLLAAFRVARYRQGSRRRIVFQAARVDAEISARPGGLPDNWSWPG